MDGIFFSKYNQEFSIEYQRLSANLPKLVLYKSAARFYKTSGLLFLLNSDPDWCHVIARSIHLRCNPYIIRLKSYLGNTILRHSDTYATSFFDSREYFNTMNSKGLSKGLIYICGNERYTDGISFLGTPFFRENEFHKYYDEELKLIVSKVSELFSFMELEYNISNMKLFDFEKNIMIKYRLELNKKIQPLKKESLFIKSDIIESF